MKILLVGPFPITTEIVMRYDQTKKELEVFGFEVRGWEYIPNYDWLDYVIHEILILEEHDAIYLMDNWQTDAKAYVLYLMAYAMHKEILSEHDPRCKNETQPDH